MVEPLQPAVWSQLGPLGWLVARAFTRHRFLAALAAPIVVVSLIPFVARRALYRTTDGNGTVVVCRHRPLLDVALTLPLAAIMAAMWFAAAGALLRLGVLGVMLIVVILILVPVVVMLSMSTSLLGSAVGRETPRGSRWMVANLAQRPGTEMSALLLTRSLIRAVPRGSIIVATAASEPLAEQYERLGFTRGRGRRVYRIL